MPTAQFRIGCDLVSITRFQQRMVENEMDFLERIFWPDERHGQTPERLAGMFAAKEAACKALSLPPGHWLDLCVEHEPSGAPRIALLDADPAVAEIRVSIAHDSDYALAFVMASLR
jgi:phosphopantetheine--protein transferase-like protein